MTDCPHLARTAMYVDGALPEGDEAAVLDHLATCAACQQVIGDAVSVEAALSEAPALPVRARRRWPLVLAAAASLAAAAVAIAVIRRPEDKPAQVSLELPAERSLEGRFSGPAFAPHRPLAILRGDRATEAIPLDTLAAFERRGDRHDLVAALAATGNVTRAREIAATLPDDAGGETDRAALALAARDFEAALVHATRALDRGGTTARWNLAIAAHGLGLQRVARDAFAATTEPGWRDEAARRLRDVEGALAIEAGFADFDRRGRAMVDGGAPITLDDISRYPAFARVYLLDALRVNDPEPLRPLATALGPEMIAAVERATRIAPAVRTKLAPAYRAVVARTASAAEVDALIRAARAAGASDLLAGTIITSGRAGQELALLTATVAPWRDPWFDIFVERTATLARFGNAITDPRLHHALEALYARCPPAASLRCGQVAQDLGTMLVASDLAQRAEPWARRAAADFQRAASPTHLATARALLAQVHRAMGRDELARAEFAEVIASKPACALERYARLLSADLALAAGQWAQARDALPPAVPAAGCALVDELQAMVTATDLARRSGDAKDREVATQWLDAARASGDPDGAAIATVGALRLGGDPAPVHAWLAAHPPTAPRVANIRSWAVMTLISDAGARGDWDGAIAAARQERPIGDTTCVVVASADDGLLTVAAQTSAGTTGTQRRGQPHELALAQIADAALVRQLAGCTGIALVARAPLHGRADLLPPSLPWWFAGGAAPRAVGSPARAVEVTSPVTPDPELPQLPPPARSTLPFAQTLTGRDATPRRVLALLAEATYAELHVHGIASARDDAAAYLALSPDPDGNFALRADALRTARLAKAPLVVLAACRAGTVTPSLRVRWSLADAFLVAGASGVVAVDVPIPDAAARPIFDELHRRVDAGEPAERALAAIRSTPGAAPWVTRLMLFR